MRNTKKLAGMMLAAAMATTMIPQIDAQAQDLKVFNTLEVASVQDAAQYTSSIKWNSIVHENLGRAPQTNYYKFVLAQDSVVRFDVKRNLGSASSGTLTVYSDAMMTKAVLNCSEDAVEGTDSTIFTMKKGTYYVQETASAYGSAAGVTQESQLAITAIPKSTAFNFDYTINGGAMANLKMTSHLTDWAANGYYACWSKEYIPMMQDISKYSSKGTKIDVTKDVSLALSDGTNVDHTIVFRGSLAYGNGIEGAWEILNDSVVQPGATYAVKLDTTAPTVSGVRNGATYKHKVKVSFVDASGIKSAKLNGKTIKSGKTIKAVGSYTLMVTDKHGNTRTVVFRVSGK